MPNFGFKHSEESKRKISVSGMGHKTSEETRQKISQAHKGRVHTEESISMDKINELVMKWYVDYYCLI